MSIITHFLAVIGGSCVGVAVMALCFAASKADEQEEKEKATRRIEKR